MATPLPFETPQQYICVWPGDEPLALRGAGEVIMIPPRGEVAKNGRGSIYSWPPARDAQGREIPGTVVIDHDLIPSDLMNKEGMITAHRFTARDFVREVYENQKALLARGFVVVADPADVERARAAGRPKYIKMKIADAEQTIREELTRLAYWEKKGQPAPESSSADAVREAVVFLKTNRERGDTGFKRSDLLEALGGPKTLNETSIIQAEPVVPPTPPVEETPDLLAMAQELFRVAKAKGVKLTKAQLEGLMDQDVMVMTAVRELLDQPKEA